MPRPITQGNGDSGVKSGCLQGGTLSFCTSLVVIWGSVVLRIYADWRILAFSLVCYVAGFAELGTVHRSPHISRQEQIEPKGESRVCAHFTSSAA